ncbi:MAG: hypothetical protein Q8O55_11380 [Dehalococcoidales bacterium]|nr:hypothetical protein [Dehalococcoidales bacterium]
MTTETRLTEWSKIKADIIRTKDIIELGKLNYSLEAIQKWAKQSKQSLEAQNEIAEYRLRLNRKQGEWIEANIPAEGGGDHLPNSLGAAPTLMEAGIDYHDSPKFRILAQVSDERFENYITETKANESQRGVRNEARGIRSCPSH